MKTSQTTSHPVDPKDCQTLQKVGLRNRRLIIASNRGPITFKLGPEGEPQFQHGGGGLVTALTGLVNDIEACWYSCALSEQDFQWPGGGVPLNDEGHAIGIKFVRPTEAAYDGYYNQISNPLLWFLQHSMWDQVRAPVINHATWQAWDKGYVEVNRLFAIALAQEIRAEPTPALVWFQDYHLYLAPRMLRKILKREQEYALLHFVHIPWPGPEDWGILPPRMRDAILDGLCAVNLIGFQTHLDGLNFIRTCESHLAGAHVNFRQGRIWYRNHAANVRDFPISLDVGSLRQFAGTSEVTQYRKHLLARFGSHKLIVRVDRTEPSKNIVRGFQAFEEMLDLHPEQRGEVQFLAILVPSRMEVSEYQEYLDELMAAAGRVNAGFGDSEWEPVRVLVGENYARAVAALQIYDVLLVNSIADGMNLVAKEGPIVNQKNGVLVVSERTGARQQLETGALVISPCDIYDTAEALHRALTMPEAERVERSARLVETIEREDIADWLCRQLQVIEQLGL